MSRALPYKVRGMIEWHLRHYHEDKKQLEQIKTDLIPSYTTNPAHSPVKTSSGDPTSDAADRIMSSPYILSLERTIKAIDYVMSHCDATDRKLIDLVYWQRTHTVEGAALAVNLTKSPAYDRINKILRAIAVEIGYLHPQE